MKKTIAIYLSIITIIICGWFVINSIDLLDIASNKNDTYANFQKKQNRIQNRYQYL